jgi:FSR family fosmidomycin resistance protein-like MFS transporter
LPPLILSLVLDFSGVAFVLAALVGFIYGLSFTSAVVLGQECLPARLGLTSAVTLGAAMGAGGLVAALLGPLGDGVGLTAVMLVIAALPLPALALSILFRRLGSPHPGQREALGGHG